MERESHIPEPFCTTMSKIALCGNWTVLKRATDIVLAIPTAILAIPLVLLISLLVKLTSEGPVFFTHTRLGRQGRPFEMWKFRTMHADSHAILLAHFEGCPDAKEEWERERKLRDDPRVTLVGKWLRRSSMDELPQLWNVLRGDMSLVGPRPIVAEEAEKYGSAIAIYQHVRPGLTGLWQVSGRNHVPFDERVVLDTRYVMEWQFRGDIAILFRTVKAVLTGDGAY